MLGLQNTCGGKEKFGKLAGPKKNRGSAQPEGTTVEITRAQVCHEKISRSTKRRSED